MLRAAFRLLFLNLLLNLLLLPFALASAMRRRPRWVRLDVKEPLPARPARVGFRRGPSVASLSKTIGELAADPTLEGVMVALGPLGGGWAKAETLRGLLHRLVEKGKRVVVHLSSPGLHEYYVATAAHTIVVDESGPLGLLGLAAEVTFFGGALPKIGAEAQAEYRGPYKSFAESFLRKDMSPAHREAIDAILDDLQADLVSAIAAGRHVDAERAAALLTGGPYVAAAARDAGLVDRIAYRDELEEDLGAKPSRRRIRLRWRRLRPARTIRVLALHGSIVPGEGGGLPRRALAADAAARAIAAARKDPRVAAVVLHLDSRGGSAAASDLIWHEVARCGASKPVVAYLDDVAASGGYYIACAAARIVAQPGTLTGSIGVVAGKIALQGLYQRLGLSSVILTRGEVAAMNHVSRPYSAEERRRLAAEVDALYRQFVGRVAAGRGLSPAEAEAVAGGRVWSGKAAHARRLVDVLGDVDDAIRAAETLVRRPGEHLEIEDVAVAPRRRGILSLLPNALQDLIVFGGERALFLAPEISVD